MAASRCAGWRRHVRDCWEPALLPVVTWPHWSGLLRTPLQNHRQTGQSAVTCNYMRYKLVCVALNGAYSIKIDLCSWSPSVLWRCWLGGRKGMQPGKNWVAQLSVWSEVQTCIWPSWCHCHSLSLAPVKFRLVFTARCYASAALAMGLCMSVCLCLSVCVCHKSEFY